MALDGSFLQSGERLGPFVEIGGARARDPGRAQNEFCALVPLATCVRVAIHALIRASPLGRGFGVGASDPCDSFLNSLEALKYVPSAGLEGASLLRPHYGKTFCPQMWAS